MRFYSSFYWVKFEEVLLLLVVLKLKSCLTSISFSSTSYSSILSEPSWLKALETVLLLWFPPVSNLICESPNFGVLVLCYGPFCRFLIISVGGAASIKSPQVMKWRGGSCFSLEAWKLALCFGWLYTLERSSRFEERIWVLYFEDVLSINELFCCTYLWFPLTWEYTFGEAIWNPGEFSFFLLIVCRIYFLKCWEAFLGFD